MSKPEEKFLHIPLLDQMRESLIKTGAWGAELSAADLKSLLDQGLEVALRKDSSVSVTKSLDVEIEGQQAYIEGDAHIRYKGADIFINIDELSLNQKAPGELGIMGLKYGLRLDKSNAGPLVQMFGNEDKIKADLEKQLRNPNKLIWDGISGQIPPRMNIGSFALNLNQGKLGIDIRALPVK